MIRTAAFSALVVLVLTGTSSSVAPTREAVQEWLAQGVLEEKARNWAAFKAAGGCAPNEYSPLKTLRSVRDAAQAGPVVDTIHVVVLLAEFTDWRAADQSAYGTPEAFDSLLFSNRDTDPIHNPTGSMTDYYLEISYGSVYIKGDIYGWYMMPETYAYYVDDDDGLQHGHEIIGAAVDSAEANGVDFSLYANGDSWVDGVIVIHAGPGAEANEWGIWSHASAITPLTYDGVGIRMYIMCPEEQGDELAPIGVICHEWGHILGAYDMYDQDLTSPGCGLGDWSLMGSGSWNGYGLTPAHPDAFTREQMGLVEISWLDSNLHQVELPQVEESPVVYGMKDNPLGESPQYWLIENRQQVGFDVELPGAGLCIYHVDEDVPGQHDRFRYMVAFEQADGRNDLALRGVSDNGDPWPGATNNRNFHDLSVPDSKNNFGVTSEVGVQSISSNGSVMHADLDVYFSRPWIEFSADTPPVFIDPPPGGDGDEVLEAGETIEFHCRVVNKMRSAYAATASLTVDAEGVQFLQNDVPFVGDFITYSDVWIALPVRFSLPVDFESIIARFTLTIVADSVPGSGDRAFTASLEFDHTLGAPQVLIVDDDNGQTFEQRFSTSLTDLRLPSETWDKSVSSPLGSDLQAYKTVIWHTGKNDGGGGTITVDDIAALTQFLEGGGSLFLSSLTAASQLHSLDSAFMADYLHATLAGPSGFTLGFMGIDGNVVADGTAFTYYGNAPINPMHDGLNAYADGQTAFYLADEFGSGNFGDCAVTYLGDHRTVFATFGAEFISEGNDYLGFQHRDTLLVRVLDFFTHSYPYVRSLLLEVQDADQVADHTPTILWSVVDTGASVQAEYEIEVGSDNDWTAAEMWVPGVTGSPDSSVTYAGAPLLDSERYWVRLRSSNGTIWSEWLSTSFHVNTLPLAPQLRSPSDGRFVGNPPILYVSGGSDEESNQLYYQFEVYADEELASVVTSSPNVEETPDSTGWLVDAVLDELTPYWWRARTHDGAEYSAWSDSGTFLVNSAYEPPWGRLVLPSVTVAPCDTSSMIQPVVVEISKPLTKATIPLQIPGNIEILEVSFDGLPAEPWDLNSVVLEPESGLLLVRLDNSLGYELDLDTPTVLVEISFTVAVPCRTGLSLVWDTARYAVPAEVLSFTDTMETFGPEFDAGLNETVVLPYIPGEVDGQPAVDIGDVTYLVGYLFLDGAGACVANAADLNGDCEGPDIGDLTALIRYLFAQGEEPRCGCVTAGATAAARRAGMTALPE